MNLLNIVRETLDSDVTITDWEEYVNPSRVIISLSNGRKVKVAEKHVEGGRKMYSIILTLLQNMDTNPRAEEAILKIVRSMIGNLSQNS